jgi:hypothetical protein
MGEVLSGLTTFLYQFLSPSGGMMVIHFLPVLFWCLLFASDETTVERVTSGCMSECRELEIQSLSSIDLSQYGHASMGRRSEIAPGFWRTLEKRLIAELLSGFLCDFFTWERTVACVPPTDMMTVPQSKVESTVDDLRSWHDKYLLLRQVLSL